MPVIVETGVGRAEFRKGEWSSANALLRDTLEVVSEMIEVDGWAADWEEQFAREALALIGGGRIVSSTRYLDGETDDRLKY